MAYHFLTSRRDGTVEYLTLNRPDVRNTFNDEVIAELTNWASVVSASAHRHEVRVAVLAGAGQVFCAGADATWMSNTIGYTEGENLRDARAMAGMYAALDELPVPLICRLQGAAFGGGVGLAAVCDIVVAEDHAVLGFTEVKLGIVPATISPFVLAKIGRAAARELFLTGARFSATRAQEIGLVHAVVPPGGLDTRIAEYIREILTAGPAAVIAAKVLIRDVWGRSAADAMATTTSVIATQRVSPEGQEGLKAFLEKRQPSWAITQALATEDTEADRGDEHRPNKKP